MKKVYLSPSNQKSNKYAYGNTTEAIQAGRIAKYCKVALERCGVAVMVGQYDTMKNRCLKSNAFGADLHVPIHTNAYNGSVNGARLFCYNRNGKGWKACSNILSRLKDISLSGSGNIKVDTTLFEVHYPSAPTAYVEVDFHDVPKVAKWIIEHAEQIGEAIAHGICDYLGVTWKPKALPKMYRIQVGAYSDKTNAERFLKIVRVDYPDAYIVES